MVHPIRVLSFSLLAGLSLLLQPKAVEAAGKADTVLHAASTAENGRHPLLEPKIDKNKGRKVRPLGLGEVWKAGPIAIGLGGGVTSPHVAGTGVAGLMTGRIEAFWAEIQLKPGPLNSGAVYIGNRRYGYRTGQAYVDGWYDKGLFLGTRMFRIGSKSSYNGDSRPRARIRHDLRVGVDFEMDLLELFSAPVESTAEGHLIPYVGLLYAFEVKASQDNNTPTHYGGGDFGILFGAALGDVLSLRGWAGVEGRGSGEDGDNSNDGFDDTEVAYLDAGLGIGALFLMGPLPTEIELLYHGRIDTRGDPASWSQGFDFDVILSFSWRPSET